MFSDQQTLTIVLCAALVRAHRWSRMPQGTKRKAPTPSASTSTSASTSASTSTSTSTSVATTGPTRLWSHKRTEGDDRDVWVLPFETEDEKALLLGLLKTHNSHGPLVPVGAFGRRMGAPTPIAISGDCVGTERATHAKGALLYAGLPFEEAMTATFREQHEFKVGTSWQPKPTLSHVLLVRSRNGWKEEAWKWLDWQTQHVPGLKERFCEGQRAIQPCKYGRNVYNGLDKETVQAVPAAELRVTQKPDELGTVTSSTTPA